MHNSDKNECKKKTKSYFISDLHLPMNRDINAKKERLISFLDKIKEDATELFLVGDIFDFWYEWRSSIPAYQFDFFCKLKELINQGVEIHFVTGNHDFIPGPYLEKEVGLICHYDKQTINLYGKSFYIAHGDGLAPEDKLYRFYKGILRNKITNWLWKTFVTPDLGVYIAKFLSKKSKENHRERSYWHKTYQELAKKQFKLGFDFFICGHLHSPLLEKLPEGVYANSGDWLVNFSFLEFDGEELSLHFFK